jgi:hypothetical protein
VNFMKVRNRITEKAA